MVISILGIVASMETGRGLLTVVLDKSSRMPIQDSGTLGCIMLSLKCNFHADFPHTVEQH